MNTECSGACELSFLFSPWINTALMCEIDAPYLGLKEFAIAFF